jgi:hypothetical protein
MSQHYANVVQQQMQVSLSDSPFSCIETLDNTEYLWILYQACFQSAGLNVHVPAITIPPLPPFEPMAPWTFTPNLDAHVWELIVFYIFYSINIIKKPSLIPWSIKLMCSIALHQPLWERLVNRRVGRGTHLSKDSSTILRAIVDITRTILCLRKMHKSWYEFGSCHICV